MKMAQFNKKQQSELEAIMQWMVSLKAKASRCNFIKPIEMSLGMFSYDWSLIEKLTFKTSCCSVNMSNN